jgi:hypothetical protein
MELQPKQEETRRAKIPPTTYQPIFCHQDLKIRHNSLLENYLYNMSDHLINRLKLLSGYLSSTQYQSTQVITLNNSVI